MAALANENGAVPAQDDADNALAASSVGEINHADPHGGMTAEHYEQANLAHREARMIEEANRPDEYDQCAMPPLTEEQVARRQAIESGEACHVLGCPASPAKGHKHDVSNPFNRPRAEVEARDERRAWRDRRGPHLGLGLGGPTHVRNLSRAQRGHLYELHSALRMRDNRYGVADEQLRFPTFTDLDMEITGWRPWPTEMTSALQIGAVEELPDGVIDRYRHFGAVLDDIEGQHDDRHWFYAHPMCRACYSWADAHLARWILVHGPRKFPADEWDGTLPPMPYDDAEVDFLTDDDLDALPEPGWLIDKVLPDHGTGILRARDQSFKSFMALDMALQVVGDGKRVLYCIGEGANQFKHRRDAWLEHNGWDVEDIEGNLHYLPAVPNLFAGGDLYDKVLMRARTDRYDLIVIDTYARATAGSDLNSQADQTLVTARVDELKTITGGTVLLVAHSQKSDQDSSGSIEIEDARDFVFSMKRNGNEATFEVTKQKDGIESTKPLRYVAKPVGQSIVLIEAGEGGHEPLMTAKDWIVAALDNTRGLGPQSEAEIRGWVNTHEDYRRLGNRELTKSTSSSTLSRLVESGRVSKTGHRYSLADDRGAAS